MDSNSILVRIVMQAVNMASAEIAAVRASLTSLVGPLALVTLGVGALSAALLLHGVGAAVTFQESMTRIQTQAGASAAEVSSMGRKMEQLSLTGVGQSADALAQSLYHVESAGYRAGKAYDIVKLSAEGARVGNADLETVTNALTGILVSNIKGVKDATDAMAELNAIVGTGNIRMQDVAASIGTGVIPVFKAAGLSLQDYGAALATATDNSMGAETAATKLRTMIQMMIKPTAAAADALSHIGMTANQLAKDMQTGGLLKALEDFKKHLLDSGYTAQNWGGIVSEIFGRSRSSAMPELLMGQLDRMKSKLKEQIDLMPQWPAAVTAAENTVGAKFDQLKAIMGTLSLVAASTLLPAMSAVASVLINVAIAAEGVIQATEPVSSALMVLVAAFAALQVVIIGGELASKAYMFAMRNTFAVISHEGAIMNSAIRLFQAMTGAQMTGLFASKAAAEANAAQVMSQDVLTASVTRGGAVEAQMRVVQELKALRVAQTAGLIDAETAAEQRKILTTQLAAANLIEYNARMEVTALSNKIAAAATGDNAAATEALAAAELQAEAAMNGETVAVGMNTVVTEADTAATDGLTLSVLGLTFAETMLAAATVAGVVILGVLAYEKIPALHKGVNDLADRIRTDLTQAFTDLGKVIQWIGDNVGPKFDDWINGLEAKLGPLKSMIDGVKDAVHGLGDAFGWAGDHMNIFGGLAALATGGLAPIVYGVGAAVGFLDGKLQEQARDAHFAAIEMQRQAQAVQNSMRASKEAGTAYDSFMTPAQKKAEKATKDFAAELNALAAAAYNTLDPALKATQDAMTKYANHAISEAKKATDGMIAEIERLKTALAQPLPEMKLVATPNAAIAGSSTANLKQTTAGMVLSLSSEAMSGLKDFQNKISQWPTQYQAAFNGTINTYKSAVADAYNGFVQKYNDENKRHEDKIKSLNSDEQAKVKAARDAAQQKMDAENQKYIAALQAVNQTHTNRLQTILQEFETTFQTMLANFNAGQSALNQRAQAWQQSHADALQSMQATEQAKLQAIEDKKAKKGQDWVDQQKQIILNGYDRALALESTHYQNGLKLIEKDGENMTNAFNRHVTSLTSGLQDKIDAEARDYAESINKLNDAHRRHETNIESKLVAHIAQLRAGLAKNIDDENKKNKDHQEKMRVVLDEAIKKLADHLNKMTATQQIAAIDKSTQDDYNKALNQATADILNLGHVTQTDMDSLKQAAAARDKFTKAQQTAEAESGTSSKKLATAASSATDQLTAMTDAAKKATDEAIAQLTLAIERGDTNLDELVATGSKLQTAQLAGAADQARAAYLIAKASGDFVSAMDAATKKLSADIAKYQQDTASGHAGDKLPADVSPIKNLPGEDRAVASGQTVGQADTAQLLQDQKDRDDAQNALIAGDILAAKVTGDWTQTMTDSEAKIKTGVDQATAGFEAAFQGLGGTMADAQTKMQGAADAQEQSDRAKRAADAQWTTDMINSAYKAGDLSAAFDLLSKQINDNVNTSFNAIVAANEKGLPVTQAMIYSWKQAKDKQNELTLNTIKAAQQVGDFTAAIEGTSKMLSDNLKDAENKYVSDVLNHTGNLQADTQAIKDNAVALYKFNAIIAQADEIAKEQAPASYDQVVSAMQKVGDDLTKIIDAQTAVIKAEGDMQVSAINQATTAIEDQSAVISGQSGISKAIADGQVKAIQDGSAIFKAQMDLSRAKTADEIRIAQATLKLAQDKMRADAIASSLAVGTAQAELHAAQDKAILDQQSAAAQMVVLRDGLVVDQLKVQLARDNLKVAQDQMAILNDIDQALGGATDFQKQITADQNQIAIDNANIAKAMQQQAIDQAKAAAEEALIKQQEAQDAQSVELAKAAEAQQANADAIQQAKDQAQIDAANAQKSADTNADNIVASVDDTKAKLEETLRELLGLETRAMNGLGRLDVTKQPSDYNMLDGWASDSSRQAGVPGQ